MKTWRQLRQEALKTRGTYCIPSTTFVALVDQLEDGWAEARYWNELYSRVLEQNKHLRKETV